MFTIDHEPIGKLRITVPSDAHIGLSRELELISNKVITQEDGTSYIIENKWDLISVLSKNL